jgi:hypothetical protein
VRDDEEGHLIYKPGDILDNRCNCQHHIYFSLLVCSVDALSSARVYLCVVCVCVCTIRMSCWRVRSYICLCGCIQCVCVCARARSEGYTETLSFSPFASKQMRLQEHWVREHLEK